MKRLCMLLSFSISLLFIAGSIGFGISAAQNNTLFDTALERSVPYQLARSEYKTASEKLERIKTDPLAIKPELLEAQLAAEATRINLTASKLEVRKSLIRELFAWQEATGTLELTKLKKSLFEANLNSALVRFKSGAINQLEVAKVEADAKSASIDQENAQTDLEGAASLLTTRLGSLPNANVTMGATEKPQRAPLEAALINHPRVIDARARLDRSKLDLEIKDNEYSAAVDVTNAKTTLINAQKGFDDSKVIVKAVFSNAWDAYINAGKAIPVRERARGVAKEDLEAQQARFKKGLVSKLSVQQAQLGFAQTESLLEQAQHRLTLAVVDISLAANNDLWK